MSALQQDIAIVGAGGHAKVAVEVIRAQGLYQPVVCVDPEARGHLLGVPIVGGDEKLPAVRASGVALAFVAIGSNRLRERLGRSLVEAGFRLPSAVDPSARLSPTCSIGSGVLVMPHCVVNADAVISDLVILNTGSIVEHDCHVGTAAHLGPRSVLAGGVRVGSRAFLGAGSVVIPQMAVGEDVTCGAGGVIVASVPAGQTVVGVPARVSSRRTA